MYTDNLPILLRTFSTSCSLTDCKPYHIQPLTIFQGELTAIEVVHHKDFQKFQRQFIQYLKGKIFRERSKYPGPSKFFNLGNNNS